MKDLTEERRLDLDEKPLVVQLNWNKDDREGRFVLKNENDILPKKVQNNGPEKQEKEGVIQNFKRTLSKKEKKKEKRRDKEAFPRVQDGDEHSLHKEDGENSRLAAEVYKDMPETSFTRTISNPEVVMKRRRQQKLEKRMQEFRNSDGRPDSGVLREDVMFYQTSHSEYDDPCQQLCLHGCLLLTLIVPVLVCYVFIFNTVLLPPGSQHSDDKGASESILDDADCPLQIFREWPSDKETLVFQLKKRPPDYVPKKARKPDEKVPRGKSVDGSLHVPLPPEKLPYLVELSPVITLKCSYCEESSSPNEYVVVFTVITLKCSYCEESSSPNEYVVVFTVITLKCSYCEESSSPNEYVVVFTVITLKCSYCEESSSPNEYVVVFTVITLKCSYCEESSSPNEYVVVFTVITLKCSYCEESSSPNEYVVVFTVITLKCSYCEESSSPNEYVVVFTVITLKCSYCEESSSPNEYVVVFTVITLKCSYCEESSSPNEYVVVFTVITLKCSYCEESSSPNEYVVVFTVITLKCSYCEESSSPNEYVVVFTVITLKCSYCEESSSPNEYVVVFTVITLKCSYCEESSSPNEYVVVFTVITLKCSYCEESSSPNEYVVVFTVITLKCSYCEESSSPNEYVVVFTVITLKCSYCEESSSPNEYVVVFTVITLKCSYCEESSSPNEYVVVFTVITLKCSYCEESSSPNEYVVVFTVITLKCSYCEESSSPNEYVVVFTVITLKCSYCEESSSPNEYVVVFTVITLKCSYCEESSSPNEYVVVFTVITLKCSYCEESSSPNEYVVVFTVITLKCSYCEESSSPNEYVVVFTVITLKCSYCEESSSPNEYVVVFTVITLKCSYCEESSSPNEYVVVFTVITLKCSYCEESSSPNEYVAVFTVITLKCSYCEESSPPNEYVAVFTVITLKCSYCEESSLPNGYVAVFTVITLKCSYCEESSLPNGYVAVFTVITLKCSYCEESSLPNGYVAVFTVITLKCSYCEESSLPNGYVAVFTVITLKCSYCEESSLPNGYVAVFTVITLKCSYCEESSLPNGYVAVFTVITLKCSYCEESSLPNGYVAVFTVITLKCSYCEESSLPNGYVAVFTVITLKCSYCEESSPPNEYVAVFSLLLPLYLVHSHSDWIGRGNHYAYYSYRQQEDGSDSRDKPKLYRLQMSVTEVGSDKIDENSIQLFGPGIQPHHCDLTHMDGMVTVIPSFDAETYVDGQQIAETTMLRSGMKVQFGSSHVFKFVDPSYDHGMTKRSMDAGPMVKGQRHKSGSVPETTFELDGDIHSGTPLPTSKSSSRLDIERSTLGERSMVKPMVREQQQDYRKQESRSQDGQGPELILPASIEFRESSEDAFLSAIINYTNSSTVHFKLSPTYVLYMTCRYVLSSHFRPDMSPSERTHKVIAIVNKMVSTMEGVIQKQKNIAGALAFWMANASELLNFIKQDKDLSRVTLDAQDVLAHLVQMAFKSLSEDVLNTLTGAMSLLRRCRVNAALTIQLFSQLFHFINMWLFNKLVTEPDSELCSHYWGAILRQQLGHIEAWAEKQGLELAADCHLSRIVQATTLLTMDKYSMQDVPNINNTCFKLNSLQLQALLQNYHCAPDEPYIPPDLIENVVAVAENTADELARSDGREVQLEEDPDLQLPFLLPEDGYSCDVVRNIPNGFQEFLEPLCQRGYCRLTPHPRSPGTWTMYFEGADYENHFSNDSTELGAGQEKLGIYVKSVVKGGAADIDGRLAAGDQLLSVDGRSLVGLSQERAAELMTRTGSVVTLEVAKQGAIYHGLATLLNQPSPMMQRASDRGRGSGKPRPKSEGFELYNNSAQNGSPESPQMSWGEPPEPKKTSGEERLLKNRADHRSSPNVANQAQSPGGKPVYSGGPTSKITSVSTGNLCTDEQQPSPHPEAYPIPTQTYTREYFTFPASKSQDRMGPGPEQQWQNYEDRPPGQPDDHHSSNMSIQRVTRSQEELCDDRVSYQPERMRQEEIVQMQQREMEYQRERDNGEHWNHQVSSSVESSTSSQEHLNYSSSSSKAPNHKSGPGRWKTPGPPNSAPVAVSQPIQSDLLPPPPPPPPVYYTGDFDTQADLPLPLPPPGGGQQQAVAAAAAAADRKKRDEQQRWYEKEKARLEDERDRKRREQDRKLGQVRIPPGPGVPPNLNHHHQQQQPPLSPMPIQHQQHQHPPPTMPLQQQQYHPPPMVPQQPPWIEKPSSLPRAPPPPQDTVIRELLPQQQPRTIERRDLQYIVSKEDLTSGDSLSPDPWKRDAREKMEKQQQLHIVDMLNKEIQELQVKPERTAEENDRLRKLMLEWQFQKRLQESKQNEEDEEEEDDEDVDTMLIMQRLEAEKRARQTAVPAISVLDLLQDEERRRKQQLEEIRKREAEERAKQEERLRREEERNRREAEEKQRRQEEEYYNRLEAERRRQHDEAERKLLPPDESATVSRSSRVKGSLNTQAAQKT
ncbi:UNVERIFIED_CONTAM: hypothetical protein FKN15_023742 [Acipenser sinensis]